MSRVSAQLHGRSPVPSFSGSRPYPGMYGRVAFGVAIEPPRSAYAPSMAPTIRLGKILGIEVGLNWSLIFIYALIVWTLATDVLPVDVPNQGALTYWAIGALGGVVFYACLLAHELAHALVARRYGMKVSGITLWLIGGVSRLDGDPPSAGAEALIAAVGPLTSFVIAGLALGLMFATSASPLVSDVFAWLAYVNVALALFNLVPAFPLDGGRLLSSLFWWRQGTRQRGVHSAVRIGRVLAYVMIGLGIVVTFTISPVNGIWLAFIGWFLLSAGSQEEAGTVMKAALRSVPVSAAMSSPVVTIPDWLTIGQLLESVAPNHPFTTYPLHDPTGALTGLVRLGDLVKLRREAADGRLASVARPISEVPTARPDEALSSLIERIGAAIENRVLVFDQGKLVGIVSPVDVARLITVRQVSRP
ncbi:MAG: CBS domain-containing protein [Chloroflexi bacterium]|nr:MAG: CBS domain-containing protein [Chloroflexota bacterium]